MKLHSEHPGKALMNSINMSVLYYESMHNEPPAYIELSSSEFEAVKAYLTKYLSMYTESQDMECSIMGIPVIIT